MHPELHYQLMKARVADLHAQAQRDALASAARQARRQQRRPPAPRFRAVVGRRLLAVLGARTLMTAYRRAGTG
jgi:hypothetical protein